MTYYKYEKEELPSWSDTSKLPLKEAIRLSLVKLGLKQRRMFLKVADKEDGEYETILVFGKHPYKIEP